MFELEGNSTQSHRIMKLQKESQCTVPAAEVLIVLAWRHMSSITVHPPPSQPSQNTNVFVVQGPRVPGASVRELLHPDLRGGQDPARQLLRH